MFILTLAILVTLADQVTKHWVRMNFTIGESVPVLPGFFRLTYVRNRGAAWGMLADFSTLLIVLSVVMLAVLVVFRRHFLTDTPIHRVATGLMTAGIVGNLIDRIRLGYVVDFLDFHWRAWHFPAFNVADSAICVGVGLYMLSQGLNGNKKADASPQQ